LSADRAAMMRGPLSGLRVIEIASAAPAPFGCMVLADLGAEVLRVDRPEHVGKREVRPIDPLARGRRSVAIDMKSDAGAALLLRLVERADVLVEGFRPGAMERLGLGPDQCLAVRPELIYARMTGWGQKGDLSARAGHDINYLGVSGALHPLGREGQRPHAPINLLADFGGGGMLLAIGVLAALVERQSSGQGQVVDAAMVDGSALLTAFVHGLRANGDWPGERGTNLLDGGAPFYDTYETKDGGYMSVGALERRFYDQLLTGLELAVEDLPDQMDRSGWPRLRTALQGAFLRRTREEWTQVFAGSDACVHPVLALDEAPTHPFAVARSAFVRVDGIDQPAPAPRFSRSSPGVPSSAPRNGEHTFTALRDWGLTQEEVARLEEDGTIRAAEQPTPSP
jgi:alpha-methylacyl-CoA racemase